MAWPQLKCARCRSAALMLQPRCAHGGKMRLFKKLSGKTKVKSRPDGADGVSEASGTNNGTIESDHPSSQVNDEGHPPTYEQATGPPIVREPSSTSHEFKITLAPLDDNSTIGLSRTALNQIHVAQGDSVLVTGPGHRDTVQIAITREVDNHHQHAHINEAVCRNLGATDGDSVTISRLDVRSLKRVAFGPIDDTIRGHAGDLFDDFLQPYFRQALRPVRKGDNFPVKNSLGTVEFHVVECDPAEWGIIIEDTVIYVANPISRAEAGGIHRTGYADIGGYHTQLSRLKQLVETPLLHSGRANSSSIGAASRGLLLQGPPGTGKTTIVRALAVETGAYHFIIDTPMSPEQIKMAFREAKANRPALVQIDNIDLLAPKRGATTNDNAFLSGLLALFGQLDREQERQIVVVGTTTYLDAVDLGLRRSGYLDQVVELGLPKSAERLEILKIHLKRVNLADDVDIEELALATEGYSGADLVVSCRDAIMQRVRLDRGSIQLENGEVPQEVMASIKVSRSDFGSILGHV